MSYDDPFAPERMPHCCTCHCPAFQCRHQEHAGMEENRGIHDIRSVQRTLFLIWAYLMAEGVWNEALDYVREHSDEPTPLDIGMGVFES